MINFPQFPGTKIPNEKVLSIIIKYAKKFLVKNFFSGESGEKISNKDNFNEKNVADVIDYNKLLNELTKEVEQDIYNIERNIVDECTVYYEELILLVQDVEQRKNINLHSKFILRSIEKVKRESKGNLAKSIQRKISLDNIELRKILVLPAGKLKKRKIQEFKGNLIKQVLNEFISEVKVSIEDISDDISYDLNEVISSIRRNNELLLDELSLLNNSKDNDEDSMKKLMDKVEIKNLLCNEILNIIRE
ncbi:hypothetical protein AXF41_09210 [Clostridium haemolyticum]|uniref:hypothetical protein n=1 Tax=Clostridium haemolyticum TaxID=84025 RepID=UPI0009D632BD|nr:hypothetical protein [Clostridium haemolyticum]OOB75244.1 hypothetical protein AXF41_09210 [Clostridium haemolyticum]